MRKNILVLWVVLALILTSACGGGQRRRETGQTPAPVPVQPTTVILRPTGTPVPRAATGVPARPTNTRPPPVPTAPRHRAITFNDYVSEQTNYVDVLCIVVNFESKPERAGPTLDQRVKTLQATLARKDEVIAELMEDHLRLKKSCGEI